MEFYRLVLRNLFQTGRNYLENTFQMLGFFLRLKLYLYKVCPRLLVTPAPSLAEPHQRSPHKLEACPLCPRFVFAAQQYDSGVIGQRCNAVSPCGSSSPLLSDCCTWANVCTDLWEGLSPKAGEPTRNRWLQQCS